MKNKPNKGFIKEIAKNPVRPKEDKKFAYTKNVTKLTDIKSYAMNSRAKAFRAVKPDTATNFVSEQAQALKTHKGTK